MAITATTTPGDGPKVSSWIGTSGQAFNLLQELFRWAWLFEYISTQCLNVSFVGAKKVMIGGKQNNGDMSRGGLGPYSL
jgi:hypothetical protein